VTLSTKYVHVDMYVYICTSVKMYSCMQLWVHEYLLVCICIYMYIMYTYVLYIHIQLSRQSSPWKKGSI